MREPTLKGAASAWKLAGLKNMTKANPAWEATIARYILHCTWSHPFWSYYFISGVHLRPIPGVPPAHKQFPAASHEIMIYSLDPREPAPDIDKVETGETFPAIMTPPDLVHQVPGLTDKQFEYLLQDVVVTIVEGRAAPDVDFRSFWQRALDVLAMRLRQGQVRVQ